MLPGIDPEERLELADDWVLILDGKISIDHSKHAALIRSVTETSVDGMQLVGNIGQR